VIGMVSIFNYGFPDAAANFEQAGVPLRSLTNYSTLVGLAVEKKLFSEEEQAILLKWQADPGNWNRN
jgi:orotate phosphoribosyltransferase